MRSVYLVYVLAMAALCAALLSHVPSVRAADGPIVVGQWASGCQDETERDGSIGSYCPTHEALIAQRRAERGRVLCEARSLALYDTDTHGRRTYVGEAFFYVGPTGCLAPESASARLESVRAGRVIFTHPANVAELVSAGLARAND
jgi:hypothetical protein